MLNTGCFQYLAVLGNTKITYEVNVYFDKVHFNMVCSPLFEFIWMHSRVVYGSTGPLWFSLLQTLNSCCFLAFCWFSDYSLHFIFEY